MVTVVGMVMGLVLFGGGPMTLLSGTQISFGAGLLRVVLAAAYLACGLAALGAVGLFVSTLTEQPIAAMIATMMFSSTSFVLDSIPQVGWLHPYLLTHHWLDFGDLFRDPIAWNNIVAGLLLARVVRRGVLRRRLGAVHHQGRHQLTAGELQGAVSSSGRTSGSRGRS